MKIPHGLTWDQTRASAVRGRLVATRSKTRITTDNGSLQGSDNASLGKHFPKFQRSYILHMQGQAVLVLVSTGNTKQHHLSVRHRSDSLKFLTGQSHVNSLNPELNPICYFLALLGAHHFLHVSRIRVKSLTLRLLMSYIYMEHPFLMFLDHSQRRSTVGSTPLDE